MTGNRPRGGNTAAPPRRRTGPTVAMATAMAALAMVALLSGCGRHDRYNDPGDSPSTSQSTKGY